MKIDLRFSLLLAALLQAPARAENWMTLMDEWREQGAVLNQFDLDSIAMRGDWAFARFRWWFVGEARARGVWEAPHAWHLTLKPVASANVSGVLASKAW
jgi:hypothetical protein